MVKPGYKQTELGLLPEEWACRKIGSFANVCMCKRIFAEQTSEMGEIPFYKIGTFGKKADAYISRLLFEEYKQKYSYPQKGDVLISAAGTLGRTVVYDGEEAYFQDSNIVWLDVDKSQIINDYLYHYYKVIKWTPSEGSTIARLYNGIITSTNVAVPPKPEQEAIAEALSDIDTLIVNLEKLIAKKKAIKQGAMQELLTGKRRLPGFDGEWVKLEIGTNGHLLRESIDPQTHPDIMFSEYSMPAFDDGQVAVKKYGADMHSNRTVIYGTVLLFNKLNVRQKRIWLVNATENNAVCSSEFLPYCSEAIDLRLLQQLLFTEKVTTDFIGMSTGTSNSQKRITPKNFLEYTVYVPSDINEQAAIADILVDMDSEIAQLQQALVKYQLVKQGMMSELLTGRIRLIDKEDA